MRVRKNLTIISLFIIINWTASHSFASASHFSDTKKHWAAVAIEWAISNKITQGYPDGTFKPDSKVSEAEFLVMFIRAYETVPEFDNENRRHWADNYYKIAERLNYPVNGIQNIDNRNKPLTREKVAEILTAADGYNYSGDNAIQYVLGSEYSRGIDSQNITIANFKGNEYLTRAEAVQFIKNAKENGLKELLENPEEPSDPWLLSIMFIPETSLTPTLLTQKILDAVLPLQSSNYQVQYSQYNIIVDDLTNNRIAASFDDYTENALRDNFIRIYDAKNEDDVTLGLVMAKAAGLDITPDIVAKVIEHSETSEYMYEGDNYLVALDQHIYKGSVLILFNDE